MSENARCNITFTSNLSEEEYDKYIEAGKALRRNTYRGKDITSYHNDGSLYEMISSGRFDDIYVGDYIIANNVTWLVADIDNYLYTGETPLLKHHLTIIPTKPLITASMNDTNTTSGGYYNSKMKQETLPNVLNTYVKPAFESHIITYNTMLTNSMDETIPSNAGLGWQGSSNGWGWYDSQIDLMSEINVYGSDKFSSNSLDTVKFSYRLKNVCNSMDFADIFHASNSYCSGASHISGVRPRFLIG